MTSPKQFNSRLIADIGISMGDEGKGRVVCEVIEEADPPVEVVIKLNGGANSGHTAAGLNRLNASVTMYWDVW